MRVFRLLSLGLAAGLVVAPALAEDHPTLAIGSPAPDFRLPGVDDQEYTLASFADAKLLTIIFTSNHCPTAQAYEERIKQLVSDYASKGVAFVAINPNNADAVRLDEMAYTDLGDTLAEMKIRARHRGFNFPYLDDGPEQATARAYGPVATPHVFIFDAQRKLRFEGRIDNAEDEALVKTRDTRNALDALLDGREPRVASTKVFGCSVKWKEKTDYNKVWAERVKQEPVTLETADVAAIEALRKNDSGKVRMINVWATWCGPCVAEFDELAATHLRFRQRDLELITVSSDPPRNRDKVLAFLQKKHASMRNLIFAEADSYKLIEALDPEWKGPIPYTLVLGPENEVIYRETGSLDFLALRRAILPALDRVQPWHGQGGAE